MNKSNPFEVALEEARLAGQRGEVPVGAVITDEYDTIIARAGNQTIADKDPSAHAEMFAIRRACAHLGLERLTQCTLYVTLEPCVMCAGAISHARLKRLVFGAYDPKGGAVDHGPRFFEQKTCLHKPEVISGIEQEQCAKLLQDFFKERRA